MPRRRESGASHGAWRLVLTSLAAFAGLVVVVSTFLLSHGLDHSSGQHHVLAASSASGTLAPAAAAALLPAARQLDAAAGGESAAVDELELEAKLFQMEARQGMLDAAVWAMQETHQAVAAPPSLIAAAPGVRASSRPEDQITFDSGAFESELEPPAAIAAASAAPPPPPMPAALPPLVAPPILASGGAATVGEGAEERGVEFARAVVPDPLVASLPGPRIDEFVNAVGRQRRYQSVDVAPILRDRMSLPKIPNLFVEIRSHSAA